MIDNNDIKEIEAMIIDDDIKKIISKINKIDDIKDLIEMRDIIYQDIYRFDIDKYRPLLILINLNFDYDISYAISKRDIYKYEGYDKKIDFGDTFGPDEIKKSISEGDLLISLNDDDDDYYYNLSLDTYIYKDYVDIL